MSYTILYQVMEDNSSTPLLSKEVAVNGDTALRLYSQILHETAGAGIIPKTLSEIISAPSVYSDPVHPEELQQQKSGVENLCKLFGEECENEQEECPAATPNEPVQPAGFVCDSCGAAITEKQAEESYIISGKELCLSCFHQLAVKTGLREPEPESEPADEQPAPMVEQNLTMDSRGKVLRKWTPGEKGILCRFATVNDALEGYRKAFPEIDRTDKSIAGAWYVLKDKRFLFCQAPAEETVSKEREESSESAPSHTFRLNDYVKATDKNLPCYGEAGMIISIREDEALIGFAKSRYWIAIEKLQPQESPSKN